jgi:hypothetical protein
MYGAQSAYQDFVVKRRLWQFGLQPEEVAGFLCEYGWRECEKSDPMSTTPATSNQPGDR